MAKCAVYPFTPSQFLNDFSLKREAILFEKIIIPLFSYTNNAVSVLEESTKNYCKEKFAEMEFLKESGVLEISETVHFDSQVLNMYNKELDFHRQQASREGSGYYSDISNVDNIIEILTRMEATELSSKSKDEYFPLLQSSVLFGGRQAHKQDVYIFLLGSIPQPSDTTSWEEILDFRSDAELRSKYYALINWVNEVAKSQISITELEDKYRYLTSEYEKQYRLHQKKYTLSTIEILAAGIGGFFTDWTWTAAFLKTMKALFQIRKQHTDLLQGEGNLPGREIAYIFHAKQRFSVNKKRPNGRFQ